MKKITIRREPGLYARLRALSILVDGENVATIKQKETITLELSDDAAVIQGKMDWGKTEPVDLTTVADGQTIVYKGYFTYRLRQSGGLAHLPFHIRVEQ